jgi:hypothetical protein
MATTKQITKRLEKAGISLNGLEIEKNQIEVCIDYVENNGTGSCNSNKTAKVVKQIQKLMPEFNGGFSTAYGATILQIGYVSKGDWNNTNSAHHY